MKLIQYTFVFYILYVSKADEVNVVTKLPTNVKDILKNANGSEIKHILNTRRIIIGTEATTNRPYMVYLKLPVNNPKYKDYRRWLCGGVIIHEEYILTSAACIEDAKHFYIVSGTFKHDERDDRYNNPCIKNGAKKAIWKCIPRNYVFDGHENDNIRWMNNDIAVVKVEDEFDFNRRIRGCDFVPKPICYNNQSSRYEDPGNVGYIAGWGSTDKYNDASVDGQNLLETEVKIISKNRCKRRWGRRYHNIIENYMICSKDLVPDLSEICQEKYVDCTDVMYSGESEENTRRVLNPSKLVLHSAYHNESGRRQAGPGSGGFCENDHGGPLVYGTGVNQVVIGIISACLVKERTNQCYGPFLYTSVYKNKNLISCAIYKNVASDCDKLFRSEITHTEENISWADHPDGPARNEIKLRRNEENDNGFTDKNKDDRMYEPESESKKDDKKEPGTINKKIDDRKYEADTVSKKKDESKSEPVTESKKEVNSKYESVETTAAPILAIDNVQQHGGVIVRLFNTTKAKGDVNKVKEVTP